MAYPTRVCAIGGCDGFYGSTFQQHRPAEIGFDHERGRCHRNVLGHRFRDDRADRHRVFPYLRDGSVQCYRLLAATGYVDRSGPGAVACTRDVYRYISIRPNGARLGGQG